MDPIKDIASDFWQYAVVKASALSKLTLVKAHKDLPCTAFPGATDIAGQGLGPSADLDAGLKKKLGI